MMLNAPEDLCLPEKQHQRDENLSDDPSNPVNIRSDSKACDVPVVPTLLEAPMDKHVSYKDMIYLPQRAFLSAFVVCTAVPFVNLMCLGVNLAMNLVFPAVFSAFFHREPFGSPHAAAPTSASFSHHRRVESTVGCALCGCILIVEPTWPLLALHRCYFLVTVVPSRTAKATTVDVGF
ncbi:hypothetical protein V6N13_015083 [Hibiscus sabdariffa]